MLNYMRSNPTVIITAFLAVGLVVLGLYSMIPVEWLGATTATNNTIRLIFGTFILLPSAPILFWMIKYSRQEYLEREKRTRPFLFWMGVTYFYLTVFRILAYGFFPPVAILYLICGLITMTIWLGVRK